MADTKTESSAMGGGTSAQAEVSLGKSLTEARKNGGYTAEQVAAGAHIPAHYVRAIETDDYGMISDQLYLLPFVRKYAAFIGLDPEEVASRFIREVQKLEINVAKTAEPIPMISNERRPARGRYLALVVVILAAAAVVVLAVKRYESIRQLLHLSGASPTPQTAPPPPTSVPQATESPAALPFQSSVAPAGPTDGPSPLAPVQPPSDDSQN